MTRTHLDPAELGVKIYPWLNSVGRPEVTLLKPVARLGANEWTTLGTVTDHLRVPYSEIA